MRSAELLAPAGSMDSLKAAVSAGADAVYMGGAKFGARAYAESVEENGISAAIDYVHFHGRKLYLTVNTLLKEKELREDLYDFLRPLYLQGLDAVIVQDYGVLRFIRTNFPQLPIHASTQMAASGSYAAMLLEQQGVKRLVLPRELSLDKIREIRDHSGLELEGFIHGALCYCYSGQCLLSSLIGGRSGNRGRCAQPCRLPYPEKPLLNLKDLCGLESLEELLAAGVTSLKIEGRMKRPVYVAGTVHLYRRFLDDATAGPVSEAIEDLAVLFNRGGFTDGYYHRHNGADMIYPANAPKVADPENPFLKQMEQSYVLRERTENLKGIIRIFTGNSATITLSCGSDSVTVTGPEVQAATGSPITEAQVRKQFAKLGGTGYSFRDPEDLQVLLGDGAFLPVGMMNALRREAVDKLTEVRLHAYQRTD